MFRYTALNISRQSVRPSVRAFHISRVNSYSIVDGVKETLEKANKKTGEFLASTMETAEKAPEKVSEAASKVNKKTGEVLADGMEKVEKVAPDDLNASAKHAKYQAEEKLAEGKQKVEEATPNDWSAAAKEAKDKAGETIAQGKAKVDETAGKINKDTGEKIVDGMDTAASATNKHKQRVLEHTKGYKDLQDKGSKVETEQNRPDDAV